MLGRFQGRGFGDERLHSWQFQEIGRQGPRELSTSAQVHREIRP